MEKRKLENDNIDKFNAVCCLQVLEKESLNFFFVVVIAEAMKEYLNPTAYNLKSLSLSEKKPQRANQKFLFKMIHEKIHPTN